MRVYTSGALLVLLTPFTNAAILQSDFSGSIYDSWDMHNSLGQGAGDNVLDSYQLSGTIRIDTDLMPYVYGEPGFSYHESFYDVADPYDWLTYEITTEFGLTYNHGSFNENSYSDNYSSYGQQSSTVKDDHGDYSLDELTLERLNALSDHDTNRKISDSFKLYFGSYGNHTDPDKNGDDFFNSSKFPNDFNINDVLFSEIYGSLSFKNGPEGGDRSLTDVDDYGFKFTIDQFWLTEARVPEPATYGLFSLGLVGMAIARRRRLTP